MTDAPAGTDFVCATCLQMFLLHSEIGSAEVLNNRKGAEKDVDVFFCFFVVSTRTAYRDFILG